MKKITDKDYLPGMIFRNTDTRDYYMVHCVSASENKGCEETMFYTLVSITDGNRWEEFMSREDFLEMLGDDMWEHRPHARVKIIDKET